jgi:type IV pilus assembly protein PilP
MTPPAVPTVVLALSMALTLAACSNDQSDLRDYIAEVKARPAEPIDPIPPVKTYSPYPYAGEDGRDPFRASTSEGNEGEGLAAGDGEATGPRPDFNRVKDYLERFELDTLTMVGTFGKDSNYWGLVRDPDGVVHRVTVGSYVGQNHGEIIGIQESEITLSELIPDGSGNWLVRDASIALEGT